MMIIIQVGQFFLSHKYCYYGRKKDMNVSHKTAINSWWASVSLWEKRLVISRILACKCFLKVETFKIISRKMVIKCYYSLYSKIWFTQVLISKLLCMTIDKILLKRFLVNEFWCHIFTLILIFWKLDEGLDLLGTIGLIVWLIQYYIPLDAYKKI